MPTTTYVVVLELSITNGAGDLTLNKILDANPCQEIENHLDGHGTVEFYEYDDGHPYKWDSGWTWHKLELRMKMRVNKAAIIKDKVSNGLARFLVRNLVSFKNEIKAKLKSGFEEKVNTTGVVSVVDVQIREVD
eukprot:m.87979 g.87979  ORF g.87979 m.87979 type:complete len:134 (+) comp13133_c1_seq1:100-501(+)